ncbi:MAG: hypothetical protein EXQ89_02010 [Rhodospirillaceae bacterium]|nr:hypothetical protein [Rhodospirillaceae bacterium]
MLRTAVPRNTQPRRSFLTTGLAAGISAAACAAPARADQALVDRARLTLQALLTDRDYATFQRLLPLARATLIVPNLFKAGLILGAEGGDGLLLARDPARGWSPPAFYAMGGGSIGLQIGVQDAQVVLLIMNEKGLNALTRDQVKLGVDISIAAGPVGAGLDAATTTNLGEDIYSFSKTRGLFGGLSLEGTVIYRRDDFNAAYYGAGATTQTIVFDRRFTNPGAAALIAALPRA